jgi:hypothetical protein
MRSIQLAVTAVVLALSATSAQAYYYQVSGTTTADAGVSDLDQSTKYYFQYESLSPNAPGFHQNFQATHYLNSGEFAGLIAYKGFVDISLPYSLTSYGATGSFSFPQNHSDDTFDYVYDKLSLYFWPPAPNFDGTPWTFTLSDSPIAPPGGVPEPATWAMMILGFGLVGLSARRRGAAQA